MEEDDLVKLILIYHLECGLFGKESQTHIDNDHLAIVDDPNYFNNYLWGELSYTTTITSLHKALEKKGEVMNKSCTYRLEGCPIAFQISTIPNKFHLMSLCISFCCMIVSKIVLMHIFIY